MRSFLFLLLSAGLLLSQRTTSTIFGSVTDPSLSVIPGASLTLTNTATEARYQATSDAQGAFTFAFLPPGPYRLEAAATGFKAFTQPGLTLRANEQFSLTVRLEIGAAADQVTVEADPVVLENVSPTITDRLTRQQLAELPQSRRDFTQLLSLQNGIRSFGLGVFSFNGLAAGGATVTVDGVDGAGDIETNSTSMFNGFNFINVMSQEAIGEVAVAKGAYNAEQARTYSGNINVITRGGTNEFHGSVFENWQNDVLNARFFFLAPTARKPPIRFHQFGASLGGPIVKNKLFFFAAFEAYRQSNFANIVGQVPTASLKAQAIAAVPAYKPFFDLFPDPTDPVAANAIIGTYRGASSNTADDNHFVTRVDYRLNDTYLLTARYKRGRPNQTFPSLLASNPRDFVGLNESGNATLIRTAPAFTSETRFGFNLADTSRLEGIWSNGKTPTVALQGQFSLGSEGLINRGYSWSVEEVILKPIGRHTLKFGGIYFDRHPRRFNEEVPIFTYANVADLLANRPNNIRVTFGQPDYKGRSWESGFFVQDDYRFRPNLTINLGLRYEFFSVYRDSTNRFFNPDGPAGAESVPARFRPSDRAYEPDRNNFAPRVGFAYSLGKSQRTVIRSGFVAYAPFSLRTFATSHYLNPDLPFRFNYAPADIAQFGFRYPLTNEQFAASIVGRDVPRGYVTTFPGINNPWNMQWSFDIQRQLTRGITVQSGYVGNKALNVTMTHARNLPDFNTGIRPNTRVLNYTYRDDADWSAYHGWQSSLRARMAKGPTFNLHYTWSKVLALANGDFWLGNDATVQDETNWRLDKGPSSLDIQHRFVSDVFYEIPGLKSNAALRWVTGGWQIGSIFSANTGAPLNVLQSSNRPSSRPDFATGEAYLNGDDRFAYLNRNAFALVPTATASGATIRPGNVSKNALRSPGQWNVDISLSKNFTFLDRIRLQLCADAFNAFNHTNLLAPIPDIRNASFGRILNVAEARRMQLNARITF
jgi:hypothetical protein